MSADARPAPSPPPSTRDAYDEVAEAYALLLPDLRHEQPLDVAMLEAFVAAARADGRASATVVDAGCGTGRVARWLTAHDVDVHGVDPSPGMLAVARREQPSLRWSEGELAALPVADASADGVLCWYSAIHDAPSALPAIAAELARVLRPGGVALLAFQAGTGSRTIEHAYGTDATLTAWLQEPDAVATALVGAGFTIAARLQRAPAEHERQPQGFVLARVP